MCRGLEDDLPLGSGVRWREEEPDRGREDCLLEEPVRGLDDEPVLGFDDDPVRGLDDEPERCLGDEPVLGLDDEPERGLEPEPERGLWCGEGGSRERERV